MKLQEKYRRFHNGGLVGPVFTVQEIEHYTGFSDVAVLTGTLNGTEQRIPVIPCFGEDSEDTVVTFTSSLTMYFKLQENIIESEPEDPADETGSEENHFFRSSVITESELDTITLGQMGVALAGE